MYCLYYCSVFNVDIRFESYKQHVKHNHSELERYYANLISIMTKLIVFVSWERRVKQQPTDKLSQLINNILRMYISQGFIIIIIITCIRYMYL